MVKTVRSTLIVAVAGLALAAGTAFAQNEGGPGPMNHEGHAGMHGHHMMGGGEFGMFLHQLNLTDDQKAQIKEIFQKERPTTKPLMQQEHQAHLEFMQLITSGSFDQAKATAIASREAQTHMRLQVEHAKIGAEIYQLLNSDQKAKVAEMIAKHQQMMQKHEPDEQNGPSEQE
jgi:periplasmic protein CpxP/Spy